MALGSHPWYGGEASALSLVQCEYRKKYVCTDVFVLWFCIRPVCAPKECYGIDALPSGDAKKGGE